MVDLKNVDLLALQSRYMQGDTTTRALCAALTPLLRELGNETESVVLYPRIDQLFGAVLDMLAWGLHVDAYDALADDSEKRRMIKNSCLIHKFKGTTFSVQKIVESVFGAAGSIEEWFQYDGQPYHFRVDVFTQNRGVTAEEQLRVLELVESGKNLRSELDGIRLILSQGVKKTIAIVTTCGSVLEVYPVGEYDTQNISIAVVTASTSTIEVYSKEAE